MRTRHPSFGWLLAATMAGCGSSPKSTPAAAPAPATLEVSSPPPLPSVVAVSASGSASASAPSVPPALSSVLETPEGDLVRVTSKSWELVTRRFGGVRMTLTIAGEVSLDGDDIVISRAGTAMPLGPRSFTVHRDGVSADVVEHTMARDEQGPLRLWKKPRSDAAGIGFGELQLLDFDFDGRPDLRVMTSLGHLCPHHAYYRFDPRQRALVEQADLNAVAMCVELDPEKKEIISSSGTYDSTYTTYFRIVGGVLKTLREQERHRTVDPVTGKPVPPGKTLERWTVGRKVTVKLIE